MAVMPRRPTLRLAPDAPVSTVPNMVPFPRWRKACDRVAAALLGGETRVVVSGPPGTGKTLLLDHVARVLRAAGWTVVLRLADAGPPPSQTGSVAVLIDEADRLSRADLQQLLAATPGPIVLAGLEVLQSRVGHATQIVLSPLGREEARDYIAHWLALTGRSPAHLEAAAMRRTVEIAAGVPRLISTLLGAAFWLAESADATVTTVGHVEEAAALRSSFVADDNDADQSPPPRRRAGLLLGVAAGMLLLGAGAFVATRYYPDQTEHAANLVRHLAGRFQVSVPPKVNSPPAPGPVAAATAPVPARAPAPTPAQAPEPAAEQSRKLPPETVNLLVRRGNDMMAIGDVSAARLLFGRAAEAGSTEAMVEMGRTYDPTVVGPISPMLTADADAAARWYRRAAELGNQTADGLLRRSETRRSR